MGGRFPDFVGIGAPRCGTSWLARHLGAHPGIWMPPRKELHYFDRDRRYPSPSHLAAGSSRVLTRGAAGKATRRSLLGGVGRSIRQRRPGDALWHLRYHLSRVDDEWYASLFPDRPGLITGEITPAYSLLDDHDVAGMVELMAGTKFILLLRDPIERSWSSLRRYGHHDASGDELIVLLRSPRFSMRSDYVRVLRAWSIVPRDRFLVGFFDDIVRRPADLLSRVLAFLGATGGVDAPSDLEVPVNAAPASSLPTETAAVLAEEHLPMLRELEPMVGGPVAEWIARAERLAVRR